MGVSSTMRAVVVDKVTPAAEVRLVEAPVPTAKPGWALVRLHGRGLNHSEQMLREEEISETFFTAWGSLFECLRLRPSDTLLVRGASCGLGYAALQIARALGGQELLDGFDPIKDVPNGRYLTGFFSNYPTQEAMDDVFRFVAERHVEPLVARVLDFDHLPDAVRLQDEGGFQGKIVVADAGSPEDTAAS